MLNRLSPANIRRAISRRAALAARTRRVPMRNPRPIVSFTFDDCPLSAVTIGAACLERHDVRGSFYLCGGLADSDWENGRQFSNTDVLALATRGHEVGCHTFNHINCGNASKTELESEVATNRAYLEGLLGPHAVTTFAYPYGDFSFTSKKVMQKQFTACRGVFAGVNHADADLGLLKSVAIPSDVTDATWLTQWINQTQPTNGWLILYAHDIAAKPTPYGCTPEALEAAVTAALKAGFEILPIKAAVHRIGYVAADNPTDATASARAFNPTAAQRSQC